MTVGRRINASRTPCADGLPAASVRAEEIIERDLEIFAVF